MKLHENKELFQDVVVATSQQLGIQEIYVEKAYWVTCVLFNIFKNDIGKETVFIRMTNFPIFEHSASYQR